MKPKILFMRGPTQPALWKNLLESLWFAKALRSPAPDAVPAVCGIGRPAQPLFLLLFLVQFFG
jgi:hypothetical protein